MPAALLHILYMPRVSGPGLASAPSYPIRCAARSDNMIGRRYQRGSECIPPSVIRPGRTRLGLTGSGRVDRTVERLRGGSAPRKAWPDHRYAPPVVLVLLAKVFDQVSLLEANRHGHVDRHRDSEQEVAQGHRRCHPEGRGPPDIERVTDATVKHRRAERHVRVLTASQECHTWRVPNSSK